MDWLLIFIKIWESVRRWERGWKSPQKALYHIWTATYNIQCIFILTFYILCILITVEKSLSLVKSPLIINVSMFQKVQPSLRRPTPANATATLCRYLCHHQDCHRWTESLRMRLLISDTKIKCWRWTRSIFGRWSVLNHAQSIQF